MKPFQNIKLKKPLAFISGKNNVSLIKNILIKRGWKIF